ncbi:hypothetical protein [Nostoc sp.]|uniref:hypothetical protein n=1 Tax=Nostoc sp. TaxID=1180 RepID=UPI003FA5BEC7
MRSASLRSASLRSASLRLASLRLALRKSVRLRSALLRSTLLRFCPLAPSVTIFMTLDHLGLIIVVLSNIVFLKSTPLRMA